MGIIATHCDSHMKHKNTACGENADIRNVTKEWFSLALSLSLTHTHTHTATLLYKENANVAPNTAKKRNKQKAKQR